jgi:prepilin-type N-terminal cleavage/methylation domain-containing protein
MSSRGFTLIELLVVIGIIVLVTSMIFVLPKRDERRALVEGSAQQLAATLRQARSMAMERGAIVGVSFNITNEPGSSGRILNNRSGGHWYQITGPNPDSKTSAYTTYPLPRAAVADSYNTWTRMDSRRAPAVRPWVELIERCFIGERHVLPRRKVRFLALADTDNGNAFIWGPKFPYTYPRPWFGFWDEGSKRLFPWGGYDTQFKDFWQPNYAPSKAMQDGRVDAFGGGTVSYSGFYYEGNDGTIDGCRNPRDRNVCDDTNGDGFYKASLYTAGNLKEPPVDDPTKTYRLWAKDESRPLINAAFNDFVVAFNPTGNATMQRFKNMQKNGNFDNCNYYANALFAEADGRNATAWTLLPNNQRLHNWGPFDMCNLMNDWFVANGASAGDAFTEISHYNRRTGGWFITLAPDAPDDNDTFPSAEKALDSISPMFEVKRNQPATATFLTIPVDPTTGGAGPGNVWGPSFWYGGAQGANPVAEVGSNTTLKGSAAWNKWTSPYYRDWGIYRSGKAIGVPVTDFVTADMLKNQKWWLE